MEMKSGIIECLQKEEKEAPKEKRIRIVDERIHEHTTIQGIAKFGQLPCVIE